MANEFQWKYQYGTPLTVKMNMVSVAASRTNVPVGLTSNLMVEPQSNNASIFGVLLNQAGASVLATDANDPPVVQVSEDVIYEVRCSGNLAMGEQVTVLADNAVTSFTTGDLACGIVVNYDPATSAAYVSDADPGYSICHIKPFFTSNWPTGYLNKA